MTPEEIIAQIVAQNRGTLYAHCDCDTLTAEQVLGLMNTAAMQGFRFGSESTLSVVKGTLLVKYVSEAAASTA
ncbi:MAG: hypothetical protein ACREX0_06875 [Noviherbaspirillum sp.]